MFNSYIATLDGSTLIAHSNDGNGDAAGSIIKIPATGNLAACEDAKCQ
jgi:hypothetical protein